MTGTPGNQLAKKPHKPNSATATVMATATATATAGLSLAAIVLMAGGVLANSNCVAPSQPSIVDGASSSEEQITESIQNFKHYQNDLGRFRDCLNERMNELRREFHNAPANRRSMLQQEYDHLQKQYDTANEHEQSFGNEIYRQISAFRDQNQ